MDNRLFGNTHILTWLQYYADNTQVDLEKVKILDITRRNKNLIPTVESNDAVLVFTEAGHRIFFTGCGMWASVSVTCGTMWDLSRRGRSATTK